MEIVIILIGISIPIAVYLWRESRYRNPAARWPQLAGLLEFQYSNNPPALTGEWKGRVMTLTAMQEEAVLATPLACKTPVRVEIGPKAEVEKAAGMVVPDRVSFHDASFERRYLVRSTPLQLGEMGVDPSMRQRLLSLPDLRVLAVANNLQIRCPLPTEASDVRAYCDVASALADAIDGN